MLLRSYTMIGGLPRFELFGNPEQLPLEIGRANIGSHDRELPSASPSPANAGIARQAEDSRRRVGGFMKNDEEIGHMAAGIEEFDQYPTKGY